MEEEKIFIKLLITIVLQPLGTMKLERLCIRMYQSGDKRSFVDFSRLKTQNSNGLVRQKKKKKIRMRARNVVFNEFEEKKMFQLSQELNIFLQIVQSYESIPATALY